MSGGIEDVYDAILVFELEDGGGDGDAALLFQFHPVGGGGALVFPCGDGSCEIERTAVEEKFFREGGFTGIRMGDDGEGAAACDFLFEGRRGGGVGGERHEDGKTQTLLTKLQVKKESAV